MKSFIEKIFSETKKEQEPAKVFVEVGCGNQPIPWFGTRPFEEYEKYIGVELQSDRVQKSKENVEELPRKKNAVEFIQADARFLPMNDESVDELFLGNVLGDPSISVDDKQRILKEAARVLKKDGSLTVKETNTPFANEDLDAMIVNAGLKSEELVKSTDKNWKQEIRKYEMFHNSPNGYTPRGLPAYIMYARKLEKES